MNTLSFQNTALTPIILNNQIWLKSTELAEALGYARVDSVSRIFDRNQDEFTEKMTQVIDNPHTVNLTVRIFSLRGCHLIAMFARTDVAKIFRKWVLDILDKEVGQPVQMPTTITPEQQHQIKEAVINKCHREGKHYQAVYRDFYIHFGIPRYQELPISKFNEALAWLNDGFAQRKQNPHFETHAYNAASHFLWVSAWWRCFGDSIRMLNPTMAGRIHDHFADGAFSASLTLGSERSKELGKRIQQDYPYMLRQCDLIDFFRHS